MPEHIKAHVCVDGEEKTLPMEEIRELLNAGRVKYSDMGNLIRGGNNLKDLDAWLSIIRDRAQLSGDKQGD